MLFKRIIPGAVVILLGILVVVVGIVVGGGGDSCVTAPSNIAKVDINEEVESAEARFTLNNASAESAPQQQVCNGWYANDLLVVIGKAMASVGETNKPILENQQKILESNNKMIKVIWISIALILVAFGSFFILWAVFKDEY